MKRQADEGEINRLSKMLKRHLKDGRNSDAVAKSLIISGIYVPKETLAAGQVWEAKIDCGIRTTILFIEDSADAYATCLNVVGIGNQAIVKYSEQHIYENFQLAGRINIKMIYPRPIKKAKGKKKK